MLCATGPSRDRIADAHAGIEAGERILVDHLNAGRELLRAPSLFPGDGHLVEQDLAVARRVDAGDHAPEGRLPAAGFADEADDFALPDAEADIGHRAHDLGLRACAEKTGDALSEIGVLYEALRYVVDVKESGWHETGSIG